MSARSSENPGRASGNGRPDGPPQRVRRRSMSTLMDFQIIQRTYAKDLARFSSQPQQAREVQYFKDKAGSITSAADLVKDQRLLKFVMTAYGMEDMAFPGLVRKLLEGGTSDPTALANKFTDS